MTADTSSVHAPGSSSVLYCLFRPQRRAPGCPGLPRAAMPSLTRSLSLPTSRRQPRTRRARQRCVPPPAAACRPAGLRPGRPGHVSELSWSPVCPGSQRRGQSVAWLGTEVALGVGKRSRGVGAKCGTPGCRRHHLCREAFGRDVLVWQALSCAAVTPAGRSGQEGTVSGQAAQGGTGSQRTRSVPAAKPGARVRRGAGSPREARGRPIVKGQNSLPEAVGGPWQRERESGAARGGS